MCWRTLWRSISAAPRGKTGSTAPTAPFTTIPTSVCGASRQSGREPRRDRRAYSHMVTLNDIQDALRRIRPSIGVSPVAQSYELSRIAGAPVFLKLENVQRTGAFKERGALNKLLMLSAEERARGLVAASAGNHAQAVAYHAGRLEVKAEIWMPLTTPLAKVSATRRHGAEVVLHGTSFDEAYAGARKRCCQEQRTFIHPFDDDQVIAGQGTLGPELLGQLPQLDTVIVPVGGGGLIAGVAVALKQMRPRVRVIGVQTSALPSMAAALQEKVQML